MSRILVILVLSVIFPLASSAQLSCDDPLPCNSNERWDPAACNCVQNSEGPKSQYVSSGDAAPSSGGIWGLACEEATKSALVGCDLEENATMQVTMQMAGMLKMKLENDATASPAALCSQMGGLAQKANLAYTAYHAFCTKGYMSCQSACSSDLATIKAALPAGTATAMDLERTKENYDQCKSLSGNLLHAKENIEKYANINQMKAKACNLAVSNAANTPGAQSCITDPTSAACLKAIGDTDCSNPNSTNIICICNRNPASPQCSGGGGTGMGPIGTSRTAAVDGKAMQGLGNFGGYSGDDSSGSGVGGALGAAKPGEQGASMVRGGSGRSGLDLGGSGSGGKGGGGGGYGGGSGHNAKTITGYGYGGGGGSGGYRGAGSGGGSPGIRGYGVPGQGNGKSNVDLRQFLPGGRMDPSRSLAGISGPDGITGPNSNIWKKINARYFSVAPSLLP